MVVAHVQIMLDQALPMVKYSWWDDAFRATIVIGIGNNPTLKTDLGDEYEKDDDVGANPRVVSGYLSVHRRQLPGPPTLLPMSPLQIIPPVLLFGEFAHQDSVEAFRVRILTSWKVSADEKRKYMVCMQHII